MSNSVTIGTLRGIKRRLDNPRPIRPCLPGRFRRLCDPPGPRDPLGRGIEQPQIDLVAVEVHDGPDAPARRPLTAERKIARLAGSERTASELETGLIGREHHGHITEWLIAPRGSLQVPDV